MSLRSPHGAATTRGQPGPRVEVLPANELPAPLPDHEGVVARALPRAAHGHFTREAAAALGALGGRASKGRPSLVSTLGIIGELTPSAQAFDPYRRKAVSFRKAHTTELASLAGGHCGTGPSSLVASAALQLAASRYLYDLATQGEGPPDVATIREARMQADSSRQNLLAAYELAIREGKSRGQGRGAFDLDAITRKADEDAERRRLERRKPVTVEASG